MTTASETGDELLHRLYGRPLPQDAFADYLPKPMQETERERALRIQTAALQAEAQPLAPGFSEWLAKQTLSNIFSPLARGLQLAQRPLEVGGEAMWQTLGHGAPAGEGPPPPGTSLRDRLGQMITQFESRPQAEQILPFLGMGGLGVPEKAFLPAEAGAARVLAGQAARTAAGAVGREATTLGKAATGPAREAGFARIPGKGSSARFAEPELTPAELRRWDALRASSPEWVAADKRSIAGPTRKDIVAALEERDAISDRLWEQFEQSGRTATSVPPAAEIARGQAEMPLQVAAVVGQAKEPWQMTRAEFIDAWRNNVVHEKGKRSLFLTDGVRAYPIKEQSNGRLTTSLDDILVRLHRVEVEGAVKHPMVGTNPSVPPEVLADYPDLAKVARGQAEMPVTKPLPEADRLDEALRRMEPGMLARNAAEEAKTLGDVPNPVFETETAFVARRMKETTAEIKEMGFRPAPAAGQRAEFRRQYRAVTKPSPETVQPSVSPAAPMTPPGPVTVSKTVLAEPTASPPPAQVLASAAETPQLAGGVPPGKGGVPPTATNAVPPGPGEPFAANIRLSKYPEDIQGTVKEWADAHPDEVQTARRGVRSDDQVTADAKSLVEDMGGNFTKLQKRWKPGEAWNAEEITAIRGVLRTKAEATLEAAKIAKAVDSSVNQAKFVLAIEDAVRAQQIVHGVTAESGRALRTFRQAAFDAIQSGDAAKMEEIIKRLGGKAKVDEFAADLAKLDVNDPIAVNNFLQNATKPSLMDKLTELFYNSILSGPKTHIINALSNTATTLLSPVERGGAALVEKGLARAQGRQVERFFAEVPADVIGAVHGIEEGTRAALYTLRTGIRESAATKWEFRPHAFKGNLGRVINAPSTALEAADALGYAVNYQGALNAGIIRAAKREGLQGQALTGRIVELKLLPAPELIKEAARTAEYRLFRQEPGAITTWLMEGRDVLPPLRFVIPFLRTPVNLLKFGLERSPVGVVNPSLWRNLAAKNPAASDQIARIFIGSTLSAGIALWFAKGKITGRAPTNAAERDRFYREGRQPYSVQIGDQWVQYQRLEPYNQTLSQIAAATEALQSNDKTATEKVAQAIFTLSENLVSQTYLDSLSGLINALGQPERYGSQWLTRFATGFVPASSLLRTGAQVADTTIRKPTNILEGVQAGIPGLSRNVPSALTAFGEEAQRQSPAWSPIVVSPAQQSAVDAELQRLGVEVGFVGTTIDKIKLTREQQREYQRIAGQMTQAALASLVAGANYVNRSDAFKEKAVERAINAARESARVTLKRSMRLTPKPAPQGQQGNQQQPTGSNETTTEYLDRLRGQPTPVGAR